VQESGYFTFFVELQLISCQKVRKKRTRVQIPFSEAKGENAGSIEVLGLMGQADEF
jgi:hypothetical protein